MTIRDPDYTERCLTRIDHYRLSAYLCLFRVFEANTANPGRRVRGNAFRPDTTFDLMHHFYLLDKSVRLHFVDGLGRVEIASAPP